MENAILCTAIELIILIIAFFIAKYGLKDALSDAVSKAYDQFDLLTDYAEAYVSWARQFMDSKPGHEKMNYVTNVLADLAAKLNIDISIEQIQSIVQLAYDTIIKPDKKTDAIIAASSQIINEDGENIAILNDDIKVINE